MKSLPKNIKIIWLEMAFFSLPLGGIVAGIYWWAAHHWLTLPSWGLGIVLVLTIIEWLCEMALIPYRYAVYRYQVNETDVEINKGFFFRKHSAIPIARVQNVDLKQGPLLRLQKLYRITIATGGSSHTIEALDHEQALALKDKVMLLAREARNAQ